MQKPSSIPTSITNRLIQQSPQVHSATSASTDRSSGWVTTSSSCDSANGAVLYDVEPKRPALAWAGMRHHSQSAIALADEGEDDTGDDGSQFDTELRGSRACTQAVLVTCLHLAHETNLREVGTYAWTTPNPKDPTGSMRKIMKQYSHNLRTLSKECELSIKLAPDPSKTVIQHQLQRARQAAGQEGYIAVVYSGHGIQEPPTEQGELWCYDKAFDECLQSGTGPSEYIPIMLFDVLAWAGAPTCYVWDCSYARRIIRAAASEADEIDIQFRAAAAQNPSIATLHPAVYAERQIHFAACGSKQSLPRVQGMPDDLFTACLTTPLRIALLFHNLQTFPLTKSDGPSFAQRSHGYMANLWLNVSQGLQDRLSSELSAIAKTIAWQTMKSADYRKVFGQSGEVVSAFATGFMLSQRVLAAYKVQPESIPPIPPTPGHALWTTWDLILDNLFEQLPTYLDDGVVDTTWEKDLKLVSFMADQLESFTIGGEPYSLTDQGSSWLKGHTGGIKMGLAAGAESATCLDRLPIICAAALTDEFRVKGCTALGACLQHMDTSGLARAVQGGALDVAVKLLSLLADQTREVRPRLISIWSSLVRYEAAVLALAKDGLTAERLTSVPAVRYFLDALEESLGRLHPAEAEGDTLSDDTAPLQESGIASGNVTPVIQTAAILSTIANFVSGRKAPRFVLRTLSMAGIMLKLPHRDGLVQQWGALMVAQVRGSIDKAGPDEDQEDASLSPIRDALINMTRSRSADSRAAAMCALASWIPSPSTTDGSVTPADPSKRQSVQADLTAALALSCQLMRSARAEGSSLVRRELARIALRTLNLGGNFTLIAVWTSLLSQSVQALPAFKGKVEATLLEAGRAMELSDQRLIVVKDLREIVNATRRFAQDSHTEVAELVQGPLRAMIKGFLAPALDTRGREAWETVYRAMLVPLQDAKLTWTEALVEYLLNAAQRYDQSFLCKGTSLPPSQERLSAPRWNNGLFDSTKAVLQAYLGLESNHSEEAQQGEVAPRGRRMTAGGPSAETWTNRHRILEDSLAMSAQQAGLPWDCELQSIVSPDPWTSLNMHSFSPTAVSSNGTHDILLWDWTSFRKTGVVHLDLPSHAFVSHARFVNELHEETVILAEISNGDVNVLAGSQDPATMLSVASFKALDQGGGAIPQTKVVKSVVDPLPESDRTSERKMVTTWYRSTGLLCVGGMSDVISVWDCPAERRIRTLDTGVESQSITTLITEPSSGNLILGGTSDGQVLLYDLRQPRRTAVLSWCGDRLTVENQSATSGDPVARTPNTTSKAMRKVGVLLGESRGVTTACANGWANITDLRQVCRPFSSALVQPSGISTASFQSHSGLLSTLSPLRGMRTNASLISGRDVDFALVRTSPAGLNITSSDVIHFHSQADDVGRAGYQPFTAFHPLQPFLAIGYGRNCYLRGSGVEARDIGRRTSTRVSLQL
ncbi:hypothetical protein IAU60_004139 [Kwoniella sp. DSM 27419]